MGRNVASEKMLLSDRSKSLSEEQHYEPEKQARVVGSCAITIPESEKDLKAENTGRVYISYRIPSETCYPRPKKSNSVQNHLNRYCDLLRLASASSTYMSVPCLMELA